MGHVRPHASDTSMQTPSLRNLCFSSYFGEISSPHLDNLNLTHERNGLDVIMTVERFNFISSKSQAPFSKFQEWVKASL